MTHRDTGFSGWWLTAVQVIVTVSAAVLSYWLIELPFRTRSSRGRTLTSAAVAG